MKSSFVLAGIMALSLSSLSCGGGESVYKRVFVSSTAQMPAFGGLAGGDAICQGLANTAALGGSWVAYLSTSTVDAKDRLSTLLVRGYTLVDGTVVFNAPFNPQSALGNINLHETGAVASNLGLLGQVQTGTDEDGKFGGGTSCTDWTSNAGAGLYVGAHSWHNDPTNAASEWGFFGNGGCAFARPIYCFEL